MNNAGYAFAIVNIPPAQQASVIQKAVENEDLVKNNRVPYNMMKFNFEMYVPTHIHAAYCMIT